MDLSQFLEFGKYGAYVWGAYGITAFGLVWVVWVGQRQLARQKLRVRRGQSKAN